VGNPYLVRLREQHKALTDAVSGLQTRAATESRNLTDDEFRSIQEQVTQANALADQIKGLEEFDTRSAAVGAVAAAVTGADGGAGQQNASQQNGGASETRSSGTTTRDRDPGHYRSVRDGGTRSFISDMWSSRYGENREAHERLEQHNRARQSEENRAITTGAGASGIIVPKWLIDEYTSIARQGRLVANAVRNIPLGGDPRPITLPKQTGPTGIGIVASQTTEGANNAGWGVDAFTTGDDIMTPKTYSGYQDVSRQSLASATPAVDQLIFAECTSELNYTLEVLVCNTMVAAATVATHASPLDAAGFATATTTDSAADVTVDAITQAFGQRFVPPDILVPNINRFGKFRKLKDSTGRPLMPVSAYNPMNADGQVNGAMTGEFEGLTVLATAGMGAGGTYPDKYLVARAADTVLFTDDVIQFRFQEVAGPTNIRIGIWTYAGAVTRYGGAGTVSVQVTAA
jgi:HK97 family phage major capsid protein